MTHIFYILLLFVLKLTLRIEYFVSPERIRLSVGIVHHRTKIHGERTDARSPSCGTTTTVIIIVDNRYR